MPDAGVAVRGDQADERAAAVDVSRPVRARRVRAAVLHGLRPAPAPRHGDREVHRARSRAASRSRCSATAARAATTRSSTTSSSGVVAAIERVAPGATRSTTSAARRRSRSRELVGDRRARRRQARDHRLAAGPARRRADHVREHRSRARSARLRADDAARGRHRALLGVATPADPRVSELVPVRVCRRSTRCGRRTAHDRASRVASRARSGWRSSCHSVTSTTRVGAGRGGVRIERELDRVAELRAHVRHRGGIVAGDRRAGRRAAVRSSVSAGDSRMSSVSGLNASPQTAMRLPSSLPPKCANTRSPSTRFWCSFARSTASTTPSWMSCSRAVWISARRSLGKHEPPKPAPANRNFAPIRGSEPMPLRTASMSAPTTSHSRASSFMNEIRVASIAFAAYFVSSAERMSMTWMRSLGAQHAAIELAQERRSRLRIVGADDDARRLQEVVDRVALLEELGVRCDRERLLRDAGDRGANLDRRCRPGPCSS